MATPLRRFIVNRSSLRVANFRNAQLQQQTSRSRSSAVDKSKPYVPKSSEDSSSSSFKIPKWLRLLPSCGNSGKPAAHSWHSLKWGIRLAAKMTLQPEWPR
ncbi:hypothetical protein PoB_004667700 [Plakobranchus ocellatus]|uniref:Uncharacterized protein n=1 Tax=Plakobranchus ocellatus TaxID=259542 RepID=A0AAV4BLA3_9GAST|nr:hypothetical protein PoB_004667700 [Plakobranchus ocellatus]